MLELQLRKEELQGETIETVYIGGGTPSLLTVGELQSLIDTIHLNYKVGLNPEITLEANPDDLTFDKIIEFHTKILFKKFFPSLMLFDYYQNIAQNHV